MIRLSPKTLDKLAGLINEGTIYRSGPMLVKLFNEVGFRDVYGPGFPSRMTYTKECLSKINGRVELEKVIRAVFNPREFSDCPDKFIASVADLNGELKFDGWNIYWDESISDISFKRVAPAVAFSSVVHADSVCNAEEDFLKKEFSDVRFDGLVNIPGVQAIVEARMLELKQCLKVNAPLSAIFLTGSILEAVLLSVSMSNAKSFCDAGAAPKDKQGAVLPFEKWHLESLINVAKQLGYLNEDIYKFCHVVRDFRNYIHPFEQNARKFSPDLNTAKICLQVLKGAIAQMRERYRCIEGSKG